MSDSMIGFEENEISKNANGGTELIKRRLGSLIDPELLKNFQIICSRPRELEEDKIRIFWAHDLPEDPESKKFRDDKFKNSFHKFVFVSNWQYNRYQMVHNIPYNSRSIVLENGIVIGEIAEKPKDKIRLVYTSTPQRGLEILVPVFETLAKDNPDIHLDVFSSFKIYGWDQADEQFEPLYEQIRNHPQMTYHGFVPNDQVRSHLQTAHIHAYPNIWLETSCIALIEAMSHQLVCVHPNYGGLPETSGSMNVMYQGDITDKNIHANIFYNYLNAAIKLVRDNMEKDMININKFYIDSRFNINRIKGQWETVLQELLKQYPTPESRNTPKEQFVYRTS